MYETGRNCVCLSETYTRCDQKLYHFLAVLYWIDCSDHDGFDAVCKHFAVYIFFADSIFVQLVEW